MPGWLKHKAVLFGLVAVLAGCTYAARLIEILKTGNPQEKNGDRARCGPHVTIAAGPVMVRALFSTLALWPTSTRTHVMPASAMG